MNVKRAFAVVVVSVMVAASAWAAGPFAKHPNLQAAHKFLTEATVKITAAQKANEYDMEGHAAKAKELIAQAQVELEEAAKAATANAK